MNVSVVIPTYNAERFLGETLATVGSQTHPPHEIIVADDASSDGTVELARAAGVTVLTSAANRGVSAVRNAGIRAATGDSVALLDADDLWLPDHLQTLVPLLEANPDAAVAYARAEKFGDETGRTRKTLPPGHATDAFAVAARVNLAQPSASLVRREAALALNGFDEAWRYGEDFDFWLRLACRYPIVCTDQVTSRYRIHAAGKGRRKADDRAGQCHSRLRVYESLHPVADAGRREALRSIMWEEWEAHVARAWQDGDRDMFERMLALGRFVPASEAAQAGWARRRRWFWLRRAWNGLPDGLRRAVKSTLRRDPGAGGASPTIRRV